jgi:PAS domain S-box-containing protein
VLGAVPPYPWSPTEGAGRDRLDHAVARLFAAGGGEIELAFRRKDGSEARGAVTASALLDPETGEPALFVGTLKDVTERVRLDEERRALLDRLKALVSSSPVAIVAVDPEGRLTEWNEAAERIFGWRADEVIGREPPFVPAEARQEYRDRIGQVLEDRAEREFDTRRVRRDGSVIDVKINARRLLDRFGRPVGLVAAISDVTQRKRSEAELHAAQQALSLAQRASGSGAWDWDIETGQIYWSPEFVELYGLGPDVPRTVEAWLAATGTSSSAFSTPSAASAGWPASGGSSGRRTGDRCGWRASTSTSPSASGSRIVCVARSSSRRRSRLRSPCTTSST